MFYSHDILQRRGGKFGIIWIAATKAVSLSKRDYFSVNVVKTCEDILMYLTRQAGGHVGKGPRLSLYLSSQLMVGVSRVYQKQYEYLVIEVRDLHRRFSSSKLTARVFQGMPAADIDLPRGGDRPVDACTLREPSLEQYDSDFGIMRLQEEALDPFLLPAIDMFTLSPSRSGQPISSSSPHSTPTKRLKFDEVSKDVPDIMRSPHTVSSADEITMREADDTEKLLSPKFQEIIIPGEQDLQPIDEIPFEQMMQEQPAGEDRVLTEQEEQAALMMSPSRSEQIWLMDNRTGEIVLSPVAERPKPRKGPKRGKKTRGAKDGAVPDVPGDVSPLPMDQDGAVPSAAEDIPSALEDAAALVDRPEMHTPQAPAVIPIMRLAPLDEADTPSPRRRGRKRRLVFADDSMKLSKDDMRHNMSTAEDLAVPEHERYAVAAIHIQPSVKEMFEQPARKAIKLNSTFMKVWTNQAVPYVASEASFSDEEMRPAWSIEYLREREVKESSTESPGSQERSPELPSIQQVRHAGDVSAEVLRGPDESGDLSAVAKAFEDTPSSLQLSVSDISLISADGSSTRGSASTSGLRKQRHQRHQIEDAIPEEERGPADDQVILNMGEVLLEDAGLLGEELPAQQEPELEPVAEQGVDDLQDMMEKQRLSWGSKSPELTSEEETGDIPNKHVYRQIYELLEDADYITYADLVPTTTYRHVAAKIFAVCVEYGMMQLIRLKQRDPYSTIYIKKGPRFTQVEM